MMSRVAAVRRLDMFEGDPRSVEMGEEEPVPAVRDVTHHPAHGGPLDRHVKGVDIGRYIPDGHGAVPLQLGLDRTDRRIEPHPSRGDASEVLERPHHADRPVTAHAEVAHVIEEDDAGDRARRDRRRQECADHRVVARAARRPPRSAGGPSAPRGRRGAPPSWLRRAPATLRPRRESVPPRYGSPPRGSRRGTGPPSCRVHLHRLAFGVELPGGRSLLPAAGTRAFHATEGRVRVDAGGVAIDADQANVDLVDVAKRRGDVPREQRRAETVPRVVGDRQRSSRPSTPNTVSTGPNSSSCARGASGSTPRSTVGVTKNPRTNVAPVRSLPPLTISPPAAARADQMRSREAALMTGPTTAAGLVTGPTTSAPDLRPQLLEEGLLDLPRHHRAARRGALLPGVAHGAGGGEPGRQVEIGVRHHEHDVLAAHLGLVPDVPLARRWRRPGRPRRPSR